jgi:hypothetical protein
MVDAMATHEQIVKRMRRKIEIVRLDADRNRAVYHDMTELLALLDMLERVYGKGATDGDA